MAKTEQYGRDVAIRVRQVQVSNLNVKPEKSGKELVERCDLSIQFVLRTEELPHLLHADGAKAADLLWNDKGEPIFAELDGGLHLKTVIVGTAKLGHAKGTAKDFQTARLKKIVVEPMLDTQVTVSAQVRLDPEGSLDMLSKLVIERAAKFGFNGAVLLKAADDDGDGDVDDENQGELPV